MPEHRHDNSFAFHINEDQENTNDNTPDFRVLSDGRTIVASCRSDGFIQAGTSLGQYTCAVFQFLFRPHTVANKEVTILEFEGSISVGRASCSICLGCSNVLDYNHDIGMLHCHGK
jgi:hypothetical protein